jgi:hypothetical protein
VRPGGEESRGEPLLSWWARLLRSNSTGRVVWVGWLALWLVVFCNDQHVCLYIRRKNNSADIIIIYQFGSCMDKDVCMANEKKILERSCSLVWINCVNHFGVFISYLFLMPVLF